MIDDLLQTKLFLPTVRSSRIVRQRLIDELNQGTTRKLSLISASAGFGKTTLAASWAQQSQRPTAWISLDQEDNEPTRFLAYLLVALQSLHPDSTGASSAPSHPSLPALNKVVLTQLVNEIARHSTAFSLILDDYHLITESQIHEAVAFILEHMPPNMHLMIISRQDPPLPLTRLRAQGQLVEIRQADLRFTRDETAEFLKSHTGFHFTQADIAALETRTEGWAVGLQLAAIALQSNPHPGETAQVLESITGSNRYILDYLVEEVVLKQPAMIQDFLLKTSILDHLSGSLCDAVLGIEAWQQEHEGPDSAFQTPITSQQILDYLDKANLFIIPLDYTRQWCRYHALFADLLRHRLGQQLDPQAIAHLHQQASQWYEENGMPFRAIDHALAATDYPRAVRLIETYGQRALWEQGLHVTITHWLEALPDPLITSNPSLAILQAIGLSLVGRLTAAEKRLQMAEQLILTLPPDQQRVLVGQIIVARLYIVSFFNLGQQSVDQIQHALDHIPLEDAGSRGSIMAILGHTYGQQGQMNLARQTLAEAIQLCQQAGYVVATIMTINMLILIERTQGRLSQAVACCRQALDISTQTLANEPSLMGITLLALSEIQYQRNELDEALESLTRGIQLALQSDTMISQHTQTGYLTLARVQQARGDNAAAEQALLRARSASSSPQLLALVAAYQACLEVNRGNTAAAGQRADHIALSPERFTGHTFDAEMGALVRVRIAQGQTETALEWLTKARAAAQADGRLGDLLEITILEALAFQAKGDFPAALNAIADALSQARIEGYVRLFLDEGPAMAALLRQAVQAGMVPDDAARLLASFPASEEPLEITAETQPLPDSLSTRELDVLRLMVSGYSNPEIARELVVSVGTIKTHTSHIYSKLNVRNRAEAVKRAIDLKLV